MIPPFLFGPLCGAIGMLFAVLGGWGWLTWVHDPGVRAAQVAEIAAAVAAEKERGNQAAISALESQAASYASQQASLTDTRRRIANAAPTSCAAAPPALRAAIVREPGPARPGASQRP